MEAAFFFSIVWVTPEEIKYFLMILRMVSAELNLKWSYNVLNALKILNSGTNSSMTAEDSLLLISDNGSKWHLLKGLIDLGKYTIWIIDVFTQFLRALISKSKVPVHMLTLGTLISAQRASISPQDCIGLCQRSCPRIGSRRHGCHHCRLESSICQRIASGRCTGHGGLQ